MLKAQSASKRTVEGAASLYRFIEQIDDFIRQDQASRTYPIGSRYFLDMIRRLGELSRRYLQEDVLDSKASSEEDALNRVAILRKAWRNLHPFLQPVADAHSLRVPIPLISLITHDVRSITQVEDTLFATQVVDDLNYLQHPQTYLRSVLEDIRRTLRRFEPAPLTGAFGVIGLPYSQGSSLFLNCALYHEAGHFVFQQKRLDVELFGLINSSLREQPPIIPDNEPLADLNEKLKARFNVVRPWCEELFCDLFALRMIGPVFTFVLADILNLSPDYLDPEGHLFSGTHPARYLRLREQILLLEDLEWWQIVAEKVPSFSKHEQICKQDQENNSDEVYSGRLSSRLSSSYVKQVLLPIIPQIRRMARDVTANAGIKSPQFEAICENVFDCFSHGIVPSPTNSPLKKSS